MSAITLAQKKIQMGDPKVFLETLDGLGFLSESVEVILVRTYVSGLPGKV